MKNLFVQTLLAAILLNFTACNKDIGAGGTLTVDGQNYSITDCGLFYEYNSQQRRVDGYLLITTGDLSVEISDNSWNVDYGKSGNGYLFNTLFDMADADRLPSSISYEYASYRLIYNATLTLFSGGNSTNSKTFDSRSLNTHPDPGDKSKCTFEFEGTTQSGQQVTFKWYGKPKCNLEID